MPLGGAQQVDPETLRRLQEQLGSSSGGGISRLPGGSSPLDAAREAGSLGSLPGQRLPAQLTEEERDVIRARSRQELARIEPPSPIEQEFRRRTGQRNLTQFGYDLFQGNAQGAGPGPLTGSLSGGYMLGVGDELIVSFRGATNRTQSARVDREGRVIVGELPPVYAAGRSLSAVRAELNAAARRTLLGTTVDVSVGTVRSVSVFVGGAVLRPGQYQITSLADITAALAQAGGVRKSGSLRRVRVVRANGATVTVDLYGLLGIGAPPAIRLREGDRVIVPVIGDTIAVAGGVARPGIYEIRGSLTAGAALDYAGGPVRQRGADLTISRIGANGQEQVLRASAGTPILAGDALQVFAGSAGGAVGRVFLRGYILDPGPRPLALAPGVRALLGSVRDLRPDTYLPAAVRVTRDPVTGARRYEVVDLFAALTGGRDVALSDEDSLFVLSRTDASFVNDPAVRDIALGLPNPRPDCRGLARLEAIVRDTQSQRYAVVTRGAFQTAGGGAGSVAQSLAQRTATDVGRTTRSAQQAGVLTRSQDDFAPATAGAGVNGGVRGTDGELLNTSDGLRARPGEGYADDELTREADAVRDARCPRVFVEEPDLLPVLIENAVSVGGAVRRPGAYPVAGPVSAEAAASIAEGLLGGAGALDVDILRSEAGTSVQTRLSAVAGAPIPAVVLRPGDDIRFTAALPAFEPGAVLVAGEVARPGLYAIRKGERLSELLARAGGVTPLAYPYGAVFTRRTVREQQQEGFRRSARELNEALLSIAARRTTGSSESLIGASSFVQSLSNIEATGRVVVEADPRVLRLRPDLDTVLEGGDSIVMPKQPGFVLALGDVSNPGALQFIPGKAARAYILESGGFRRSADDDRVFIVLPNGSAEPLRQRFGRMARVAPPPGSVIVVPKNIDPLYGLEVARDIGALLSQFITSVATLAILATN